jgi:uncharacterized membrane protein YesL
VLARRLRHPPDRVRQPDVVEEAVGPPTLFRLGATTLWDNLAGLVALNLAGSLCAAPLLALGLLLGFVPVIITGALLYPVVGGLIGAIVGELRGEPAGLYRRFVATVLARWRPLLLLGLFVNGGLASVLVTTSRVLDEGHTVGLVLVAFWLVQSTFLVLLVVLLVYALPLAAAYGASVRPALRNAVILAAAAPLQTLGMVALLVLLSVVALWIGLGMWLIVPVVGAVFLGVNCWLQVEQVRSRDEAGVPEGE